MAEVESVEVADREHGTHQGPAERRNPVNDVQCYPPSVRILSRYLVKRFLGLFAAVLFGSTLLILIVEMLLHLDDLLKDGEGGAAILRIVLLRIPAYYFRDLIPISAFVAAFFAFGLGARWLEILAMKSGGISPQRCALPVLGSALLLSLAALVVEGSLVIEASQLWLRGDDDGGKMVSVGWGDFWYHRNDTIYSVREADQSTRTLVGIQLFERDPRGRLVRSVEAERGRIEDDDHWSLENATIRSFDPSRPDEPPKTRRIAGATSFELAESSDLALLRADASSLSLPRLRSFIEIRRRDGERPVRLEALLHARLSDPWTVLLFASLGIPLGLSVERTRGFGLPALYAVAVVGAFFTARNVANTLGTEGIVPPAAAPWSVLLLFGLGAAIQLHRAPR